MIVRAGLALLAMAVIAAAPPPPGASSCSGCHRGVAPIPTLARRSAENIVTALDAFRDGTRQGTVMNRIAKGFTHQESVAIADWLAVQK